MTEEIELGIPGLSQYWVVGAGGFATVYGAWDEGFRRRVAIKVLHNIDDAGRRRFDRERGIMGQLSGHANVVTPYQFGYTPSGTPYLVMEYVEGGSLDDAIVAHGPLGWTAAVDYVAPIADALAHGHAQGVLHRDVKPANILLAGPGFPKLADYGIAAIRESTATQTAFTLAHSPPETFASGHDVRDERSDLYSLASTLYTALAGRTPFQVDGADSQAAHLTRITLHPVLPLGPQICPPQLDEFLIASLAKEPTARPQTGAHFASDLRAIRSGTGQGWRPGPSQLTSPTNDEPPLSPHQPLTASPQPSAGPGGGPSGPPVVEPTVITGGGTGPSTSYPPPSVPAPPPQALRAPSPGHQPPGSTVPDIDDRAAVDRPRSRRSAPYLAIAFALVVAAAGGVGILLALQTDDGGDEPELEVANQADGADPDPADPDDEDGDDDDGGDGDDGVGGLPPATNDGPLTIGGLLPQTGALAFLGPAMETGARAAVADINDAGGVFGEEVVWLSGDSGFDASIAQETVERLLAEDVDAILGPASSGVSASVIDLITSSGVIQISPSNTSNLFTDYDDGGLYFRTSPSDRLQGFGLGDLLDVDGASTTAFLVIDDPYGTDLLAAAQDRYEDNGGTVVAVELYDATAASFDAEIAAVAAADPDAIVIIGFSETAALIDALVAAGLGPGERHLYGTDGNMGNALAEQVADRSSLAGMRGTLPGVDVEGGLPDYQGYLLSINPDLQDFAYSAESYDAVVVVALAAMAAGTNDPVEVAARMNDITVDGEECFDFAPCAELLASGVDIDYEGLSGPLDFNEAGEPSSASILVLEYDDDGQVFVADTLYPEGG